MISSFIAADLKAVTDSSDLGEINFAARKPAAIKKPIIDTQTLKEPIKVSHLVKRVCHSESGSTDMDSVVTEFGFIGQGGHWAISGGGPIPKSSFKEGKT